jgi:hypothetical protein
MSDRHAPIPYDRYRAEAKALRSAAMGAVFRRLRHALARPRRRYPAAGAPSGAQ